MQKHKPLANKTVQNGSVLLEALIAILIFSFGVLALVGLQAVMIKNTSDAKYRSDANYIAQQRIGLMWSDSANLASYVEDASTPTDISALLPGGTRATALLAAGQVRVTVTWEQPGQGVHTFTANARITGG